MGKTVWMTFDNEMLDHYGRTLWYIWQCDDVSMQRNVSSLMPVWLLRDMPVWSVVLNLCIMMTLTL
jgi:hypothetical protein